MGSPSPRPHRTLSVITGRPLGRCGGGLHPSTTQRPCPPKRPTRRAVPRAMLGGVRGVTVRQAWWRTRYGPRGAKPWVRLSPPRERGVSALHAGRCDSGSVGMEADPTSDSPAPSRGVRKPPPTVPEEGNRDASRAVGGQGGAHAQGPPGESCATLFLIPTIRRSGVPPHKVLLPGIRDCP